MPTRTGTGASMPTSLKCSLARRENCTPKTTSEYSSKRPRMSSIPAPSICAYPYFRGLVTEVGFDYSTVQYEQPDRRRGVTSNNFYSLYDMAMNGLTSHSKVPLRLISLLGLGSAVFSMLIAVIYFVYKLYHWDSFDVGIAPVVIGLFFFNSIILMILGLLGEYIGFIHTRILNRPLVVEKERINFPDESEKQAS